MHERGAWIWFENEVRGPYPAWEVELVASKCRHFLVFDGRGRWVRYRDWDRGTACDTPPLPPGPWRRLALAVSRALFRRVLQVHH